MEKFEIQNSKSERLGTRNAGRVWTLTSPRSFEFPISNFEFSPNFEFSSPP
jgi:hypothetical protein